MHGSALEASPAGAAVLRSQEELDGAAAALDARGWSWPRRSRVVTRLWWAAAERGLMPYPFTRERTKSWDVWRAVNHCLATVPVDRAVLDVGAWQSEVLWALSRAGYRDLAGCDTDPRLARMPGAGRIRYRVEDFFAVSAEPGSLGALTCLSVIEHGMDAAAFFSGAASLLGPGGRLLLTTDYWPDPIDTTGLTAFGRPWTIASRQAVTGWLDYAARLGLELDGPADFEARGAPVCWQNRTYTFLWLALSKRR